MRKISERTHKPFAVYRSGMLASVHDDAQEAKQAAQYRNGVAVKRNFREGTEAAV